MTYIRAFVTVSALAVYSPDFVYIVLIMPIIMVGIAFVTICILENLAKGAKEIAKLLIVITENMEFVHTVLRDTTSLEKAVCHVMKLVSHVTHSLVPVYPVLMDISLRTTRVKYALLFVKPVLAKRPVSHAMRTQDMFTKKG